MLHVTDISILGQSIEIYVFDLPDRNDIRGQNRKGVEIRFKQNYDNAINKIVYVAKKGAKHLTKPTEDG